MNKKPLAALLLAGLCAASVTPPAGASMGAAAVLTGGATSAAIRAVLAGGGVSLAPPAQDGVSLSFAAVERTVRAHNPMIESLQKMVASVGATDVGAQFFNQRLGYHQQNQALGAQLQSYEKAANDLRATDPSNPALEAMAKAMETLAGQAEVSIAINNAILAGLEDAEEDAENEIADAHFALKKQADHQANQLVMQTQSLYLTLCTLEGNADALARGLAALDRTLPVIETQVQLGMASQLDLLTMKNQQGALQSTQKTLAQQIRSLENSLSLLLGNDAGKTVHVQSAPVVQARELSAMNYASDLEAALKNSYNLWQQEDNVRKASNDYEKNVTSTVDAYKSAQIARDAAQEQARNDFRALFDDVAEKNRLVRAAEADLALAEVNFRVAETKYAEGMISKLEHAAAQDALTTAQQAVETAKTALFTAYNTYEWAKKGLV